VGVFFSLKEGVDTEFCFYKTIYSQDIAIVTEVTKYTTIDDDDLLDVVGGLVFSRAGQV